MPTTIQDLIDNNRAWSEGKTDQDPDFFSRLFSARSGRPVGDYQLRIVTAAFVAAQLEAARCWADADGADPVGRLMDDAVTLVEPLIAAL